MRTLSISIYIYIHTHIYTYIYIHIYIHMCIYICIYKWHASYPSYLKQTLCFPVCRCSVAVVVGEPSCTIPSTPGFQKSSGWWLMVGGWFGSWSHIGMNISKIWNRQPDFVGIPRGYAPTSSIHFNPHFWRFNRVKSHLDFKTCFWFPPKNGNLTQLLLEIPWFNGY